MIETVTYIEMTARGQLIPAAPVAGLILTPAWALRPAVHRVWLHTSSLDHPHALTNYHRRGFRTFKTEQVERS